MSEYIKSDVGEFLTNRTMSFEKSPPEAIWNNIEKQIPVYPVTGKVSTMVKLVIGTFSLSLIIFAVLWFKYQNFSGTENTSALAVNKKTSTQIPMLGTSSLSLTNISQAKEKEPLSNNPQTGLSVSEKSTSEKNNSIQKTKENQATEQGKNITYSINASGLKNVTEISFVDENKKVVLSAKNPVPNSFGFYIIDISRLAGGTYSIMITTNEGSRLHKKETFK